MRKVLVLMGLVCFVALHSTSLKACGGGGTPPPPNTLNLDVYKRINNLDPPYNTYIESHNPNMYGEMVQEALNASGTYTTASGTPTFIGISVPAIITFTDRRLPAQWRFKVDESGRLCDGSWGPTRSMNLSSTYSYECPVFTSGGQVVGSGMPLAISIDDATGEIITDPFELGEELNDNTAFMYAGDALVSANGEYTLLYQADGNLVMYDSSYTHVWSSNTGGSGGGNAHVHLQDGNLVIYDANTTPVWDTNTGENYGSRLVCQNDGNLVIYNASNVAIWSIW